MSLPARIEITSMLCALGAGLIRAGEVTARVDRAIQDTAARRGLRARSFTIPAGLFVRVDGGETGSTDDFAVAKGPGFRLDQVHASTRYWTGFARRRCRLLK